MKKSDLDITDFRILDALPAKAKSSSAQVGETIGVSETTCYNRLRHCDAMRVIRRYTIALDLKKMGCPIFFSSVTLEKDTIADLELFENQVKAAHEVAECHYKTGELDYLLKTVTADFDSYQADRRTARVQPQYPPL